MRRSGRLAPFAFVVTVMFAFAIVTVSRLPIAFGVTQEDIVGMDFYYGSEHASDSIDILSVTGMRGDTVFVEMRHGDRTIASHLAFTLTDETSEETDHGLVGVVSVTIDDFNPSDKYSVVVYADRAQTKELYAGAITPVYAQTDDGDVRLVALRTIGKESRAFNAPASVSFENATYRLADSKPLSSDPLTYAYEISDEDSIDGSITYVDDEGTVLQTEEISGIARGSSREVAIPSVITVGEGADAAYWRTVSFNGSVTASYPGTSDFTILCKPLTLADNPSGGSFYFATIQLVDDAGETLATDSLNVTGPYLYTPPTRIHLTGKDGMVATYVLAEENEVLNESHVLVLDPATDGVLEGSKTYTINYRKLDDTAEATWTVVLVNGAADPKSAEREIGRETFIVKPGETATFAPEKTLEVNGETFVPVASTKESYDFTYGSGDSPLLTVYYVPDGYVAPEPYEITVRYVNVANNEVLQTHTLTSRPELRDELEITSPATFVQDGVEYVRLDGQEQSLWHSFYSSVRTYTIYYRDVNDDLSAHITITRINVEYEDIEGPTTTIDRGTTTTYVDGGTTYVDGGTTTTTVDGGTTTTRTSGGTTTTVIDGGTTVVDGGTRSSSAYGGTTVTDGGTTTTAGTGTDSGLMRAAIPTLDGLTVVNGNGNALVVDGEGRDTNTMRIDDDETPLAGPSNTQGKASASSAGAIFGIGAALVAALAFLFFVVFKRRKDKDEADDAEQQ